MVSDYVFQQDHIHVPLQFSVPVDDSLLKLQLKPWSFIKAFITYILFGTGLLLAPVIDLAIFIQSRLLDPETQQIVTPSLADVDAGLPGNLPDIEIMPVRTSYNYHHIAKCR
jgi:hypothetical protein